MVATKTNQMKFHIFLLLTFSILFLSCSKEKSRRWMVADITVLDYYTHEPIIYTAVMTYTDGSGFQATHELDSLGNSDTNGHLKVEDRTSRHQIGFNLELHSLSSATAMYSPWLVVHLGGLLYETKLDIKEANKMTVYLKPYRTFKIHINNSNCSGSTDSLWINFPNGEYKQSFLFTGCQDSIYGNDDFFNLTQEPTINVHIKSKKNGVVNISDQTFNLTPGFNNMVEIDY